MKIRFQGLPRRHFLSTQFLRCENCFLSLFLWKNICNVKKPLCLAGVLTLVQCEHLSLHSHHACVTLALGGGAGWSPGLAAEFQWESCLQIHGGEQLWRTAAFSSIPGACACTPYTYVLPDYHTQRRTLCVLKYDLFSKNLGFMMLNKMCY